MPFAVVLIFLVKTIICQEHPNALEGGSWQVVVPELGGAATGKSLGMQTVHAVLLPSGEILVASGSSWRNRGPIETFPQADDPQGGEGIFRLREDPFQMDKIEDYFQLVNNVGVYNPAKNTFFRIPHPTPVPDPKWPEHFAPNDLFCTGHLHVPDGNVLFVGGTQYYHPYRTGNRATYLYDWRKHVNTSWDQIDWRRMPIFNDTENPWVFAGLMERGRWYASLVPLLDGRLVVMGGFVGFDVGYPSMYPFQNNDFVEFFDPQIFASSSDEQLAWRKVSVKSTPNGPFTNLINLNFKPTPGMSCSAQCIKDNQYDVFKLYEQAYLMAEGRIYLTREGDWVSARTPDTAFMRKTKATYHMHIVGSRQSPSIQFSPGPSRAENITSYGTTINDPNNGRIVLFGGQPTSPGTQLYQDDTHQGYQRYAGGRGSRKIEEFFSSIYEAGGGHWTLKSNFLGENLQDDRTMHYAILLPTSQVLIINGANYDFYGSVQYPILLTPKFDEVTGAFLDYDRKRMNEGVEARLYHNVALLLPDGRIWISGGGSARATINYSSLLEKPLSEHNTSSGGQPLPDTSNIDLDVQMFDDGRLSKGIQGSLTVPTETWIAEIFNPPYLFIDGQRRAIITGLSYMKSHDYQFESIIGEQRFYLLHSNCKYNIHLSDLPNKCSKRSKSKLVLIKLGSATHGWDGGQRLINLSFQETSSPTTLQFTTPDARIALIAPGFYMLFYVDCMGKPSVAQMVRFDDQAQKP
ncbi:hypothetical protein I4U23_010253 [Adineta vaga]|nr:hypothetical protein I4U23_010253 [Adineta vaga]